MGRDPFNRPALDVRDLILLVAVLAVVSFLWSVTLPGHHPQRHGQRRAAQTQLEAFSQALRLYQRDVGAPPGTAQGLAALLERPEGLPPGSRWAGPYLTDTNQIPVDPWGSHFRYRLTDEKPHAWEVTSLGADGQPGGEGDDADLVIRSSTPDGNPKAPP